MRATVVDLVVGGVRALRIPVFHTVAGAVLFATVIVAARILGVPRVGLAARGARRRALAGCLLIAPWAVISLLWIGIGAPFQATTTENHMRFLVLLATSILVSSGFLALKQELYDVGERFHSTAGFAASIPGPASPIWSP